jgi:hypothetical protein
MVKSGRGGARARGGRPSPWQNQPTRTIRIPAAFAEIVLELVKKLDDGCKEVVVIDPKSLKVNQQAKGTHVSLSQLRSYTHSGRKVLRVEELMQFLQNYLQGD